MSDGYGGLRRDERRDGRNRERGAAPIDPLATLMGYRRKQTRRVERSQDAAKGGRVGDALMEGYQEWPGGIWKIADVSGALWETLETQ